MSQRPLRDIPPGISYSGEAARSWGRIDKGLDALARGDAAISRGLDMFAAIAQERAERLRRVEEEVTGARAETELRRRFGEAVRNLDPNDADYVDKVQGLFNETSEAVSREFQFGSEAARKRFSVRVEQFRTQAVLQSLDARERAIMERAEIEINRILNEVAAGIVSQPATFPILMQGFEAQVAPMLEGFDANRRDRVLQAARERLSLEYVRTLTSNRNFRAAEEALRTLGAQGVLSSQAVGSLRAAMVAERRQAAAEARAAKMEAYNNAMLTMQEARAVIDSGAPLVERDAAVQQATKAAEVIARTFGPDSIQARRAALAAQSIARAARDTGGEVIEAAQLAMVNGVELTPKQQSEYLMAAQRLAADRAERALRAQNPAATPEEIASARLEAQQAARMQATADLARWLPGDRVAPVISAELANAVRMGPEQAAAAVTRLYGILGNTPAFDQALRTQPELWAAVQGVKTSGGPVTPPAIEAAVRNVTRLPPEAREARKQDFDQRFTRPDKPGETPPGLGRANSALRDVDPNVPDTGAAGREILLTARKLFEAGLSEDEAFHSAAKMYASRFAPAPSVTADGKAMSKPPPIPAEHSPARLIPGDVANTYGVDKALSGLAARGQRLFMEVVGPIPESERATFKDIVVTPVARNGRIAYLLTSNTRGRLITTMLTDANGNVIEDDPMRPEFWDKDVGLRELLDKARASGRARREQQADPSEFYTPYAP